MKTRAIVSSVLLAFVGVSIVYVAVSEYRSMSRTQADVTPSTENEAEHRVIVYYFHGNRRCQTCRTIEAFTHETIRSNFADEVASGRLQWKVINVEQAENEHFVYDYALSTRSVVLVEMENGVERRFKRLDDVWQLVSDRDAFVEYIETNTLAYLGRRDA